MRTVCVTLERIEDLGPLMDGQAVDAWTNWFEIKQARQAATKRKPVPPKQGCLFGEEVKQMLAKRGPPVSRISGRTHEGRGDPPGQSDNNNCSGSIPKP